MGCTQAPGLAPGKRDEEICLPDTPADAYHESEASISRASRPVPEADAGRAETAGLTCGSTVRVQGLTGDSAARLNGEKGALESWNASSNRWNVRLRSGEVKAIRPENLEEVAGGYASQKAPTHTAESLQDDPPLLEIWSRHRENSERAKAAKKLLGGMDAPLQKLDLTVPPELLEQVKRSRADDADVDPDSRLLASVQDERIALDELDSDLQLRATGVTTRRPVSRRD